MRSLFSILILALATVIYAQQSTKGAHVDIHVVPKFAMVGQAVQIIVDTATDGTNVDAKILIKHEKGETFQFTVKVPKSGKFTHTFTSTKQPGTYTVEITSPDGKGKGKSEFKVGTVSDLMTEVEKNFNEIDKRTESVIEEVKKIANSLPQSSDREELIKKLDDLKKEYDSAKLPPQQEIQDIKQLLQSSSNINPASITPLQDWLTESQATLSQYDNSPIKISSQDTICETIKTASEGMKLAALYVGVVTRGVKDLVSVLIGLPGSDHTRKGDYYQRNWPYWRDNLLKTLPNTISLVAQFVTNKFYERYCGEYSGPIVANFKVVFKEHGTKWHEYSVVLEGRFTLRFPKNTPPGGKVKMTGEIEGNATKFTFWEDIMVVGDFPRLTTVLERRWLPPPFFTDSTAKLDGVGVFARMLTPAYFNIPIIGEMDGDNIKVEFKEARVDFSPVIKNRLLLVVMTPLIPMVEVFEFPIQKARFIFARGMGEPCFMVVSQETSGKRYIAGDFERNHVSADKDLTVDWKIKLDTRKKSTSEIK